MAIKILQEMLDSKTAAVISSDQNRFYLTEFNSSAGTVVVTENKAVLLIDFRYFEKASKTVKNLEVRLCRKLYPEINDILKKENIENVIIESAYTTIDSFQRIKTNLADFNILDDSRLSDKLTELRQTKNQAEIEFIKKAQKITDDAFSHILNFIKVGVTEREIALELEFFMRRKGSEGVAFDTITVSGKNSSLPHGVPSEKPINNGDFITMDFGAVCSGYCSDMTRTVAVGFASEEQRRIYDTVLKAQAVALKHIKPLTPCNEVDKAARDIITYAGYGEYFGHGLGHSVGIEIHENPACNTRDITPLKSGMIMTVEPGIYLPDKFGVRIEDMVLVTDDGYENLTKSPKELIIL